VESTWRSAAVARRAVPAHVPALWEPEILLQGKSTLAVWAARGVGVDPNATATLLATWRSSVELHLPPAHRPAAAAAIANAIAYLREAEDPSSTYAARLATDLTFHAVAARHGVAVGSDVAGSLRADAIPPDVRRRIAAARREYGAGGDMVLGDDAPAPGDAAAVALRRDTEPGVGRYGGGRGRHGAPAFGGAVADSGTRRAAARTSRTRRRAS
jgi:hypothetical protein